MSLEPDIETQAELAELCLRLGDDRLVIGHRLSEWCGHGPILEEDLALANIALDTLGHARALLDLAGKLEGKGRSADDLAYFREATEFKNVQLLEQPRGDFGFTIARQFLFDVYSFFLYEALERGSYAELAGIAAKSFKEIRYHLRHSSEWVLRLGDGTEESHRRISDAFDGLWMFTGELFTPDRIDRSLQAKGVMPNLEDIKIKWEQMLKDVLGRAGLPLPPSGIFMASGSRSGRHGEHLGRMLAEMQIVARSFPGASW